MGYSEHPSELSYNGPRPLTSGTPYTTPQGNPAYRPTACPGPQRLTITQDDKETSHSDAQSPTAKWNVSAGHPSKHWPRSTLLNFGTKSAESTTSLNFGTKSAESTTSLNFGTKSAESTTSLEKLASSLARVLISLYVTEPYHNNACQPVKHTKMKLRSKVLGLVQLDQISFLFPLPFNIENVSRCIQELNSKINGHCLLDIDTLTSCSSIHGHLWTFP